VKYYLCTFVRMYMFMFDVCMFVRYVRDDIA
jgi:hypothetical protein